MVVAVYYSVNHLNFNPSIVNTHDGLIFENTKNLLAGGVNGATNNP